MPDRTTERTTAFMPALSPPEVRMAIFILNASCGRWLQNLDVEEVKEYMMTTYDMFYDMRHMLSHLVI